jgi:hypothetical protein
LDTGPGSHSRDNVDFSLRRNVKVIARRPPKAPGSRPADQGWRRFRLVRISPGDA